jgi:hypothetical protein
MSQYEELFDYLSKEHKVDLLEQDMQELVHIVNRMQFDNGQVAESMGRDLPWTAYEEVFAIADCNNEVISSIMGAIKDDEKDREYLRYIVLAANNYPLAATNANNYRKAMVDLRSKLMDKFGLFGGGAEMNSIFEFINQTLGESE